MSNSPEKNLNTSKSDTQEMSDMDENSLLKNESSTSPETDNNKEASTLSKPPKDPYIEEESTIFTTARNYGSKTAVVDSGKKRMLRIVVSVVVVLALLGSVFAITTLIPKKATGDTSSETSSSSMFSIPVVAAKTENVKSVSVKNSVGKFDLYSKKAETTSSSSSTSSGTTSDKAWYVTGIDEALTSSSLISTFVGKCTSLTAFKLMEDKNLDYGLDNPSTVINVSYEGDSNYSYTITVGNKTPDSSGNYVRVDATGNSSELETTVPGNGNVYIVTTSNLSGFEVDTTSFADLKMVNAITQTDVDASYFTNSKLSKFDYLTLSGTNFENEIRIEANPDTTSTLAFKITKPTNRYANSDKLSDYLTMLTSGLSASSVVSYSQTKENLALYGLNNPVAVITIKVGERTVKLTVGAEKDSNYYVIVDGKPCIYSVAATNMAFVSITSKEYYSQFLLIDNIKTVSSIRFESEGQDITIDLVSSKDENDKDVLAASYNGTTVNTESMRNLYQYVLMLEPQEYLNSGKEGSNVLTITLKYSNGNSNKVVKLTTSEDSSRQCLATVDGVVQGLISKSSITNIINYAKEVSLGHEIKSPS